MPEFFFDNRSFNNPVEFALYRIGGKWKIPILWRLRKRVWRYGELKRSLGRITDKMLARQLRELEDMGYVHRKVYAEVPPRVDYSLTERGKQTIPIITTLRDWGRLEMQSLGLDIEEPEAEGNGESDLNSDQSAQFPES